jgi:hypothetical protein
MSQAGLRTGGLADSGGVVEGWARSELKHIAISQDMSRLTVDGLKLEEVSIVLRGTICATGDGAFDIQPLPMGKTEQEVDSETLDVYKSVDQFRALKAMCLEHLSSAACRTSRSTDFQEVWERFWPLYSDRWWRFQKEMMEGITPLDAAALLRHAGSFWYFCLISMMHDSLARGVGITSNGNLVVCMREDSPMEVGDSVWVLKGGGEALAVAVSRLFLLTAGWYGIVVLRSKQIRERDGCGGAKDNHHLVPRLLGISINRQE